jgi:hypothetical protein
MNLNEPEKIMCPRCLSDAKNTSIFYSQTEIHGLTGRFGKCNDTGCQNVFYLGEPK